MSVANLDNLDIYPWLSGHWSFFIQRFESEKLAHALMLEGPMGVGKTTLASAMVAKLLCREKTARACGQCRSCILLAAAAHPDYFDLQPEEGSEVIKVDQVRTMISKLDLTTSISERKVAYIHPAECMNAAAANALLKSLEEPAGDTVLILVSDNPGRLPVTIRSRCQAISVKQPANRDVLGWLEQNSSQTSEQAEAALLAAGGSPLRALQYLQSPDLDAYKSVRSALAMLLERPGAVSMVNSQLIELEPTDLWRWLSICTGEVIKSSMAGLAASWLPANVKLADKPLFELQRKADINRQLAATPVRGDLLLQDWLIRWAEQVI